VVAALRPNPLKHKGRTVINLISSFKETASRDFLLQVFSNHLKLLKITLGSFRIFECKSRCTTAVSTKPAANLPPVLTTNFQPVTTTPVANLSPLSTTPAVNFPTGTAGVVAICINVIGGKFASKILKRCFCDVSV
jgi:hypothetical protein